MVPRTGTLPIATVCRETMNNISVGHYKLLRNIFLSAAGSPCSWWRATWSTRPAAPPPSPSYSTWSAPSPLSPLPQSRYRVCPSNILINNQLLLTKHSAEPLFNRNFIYCQTVFRIQVIQLFYPQSTAFWIRIQIQLFQSEFSCSKERFSTWKTLRYRYLLFLLTFFFIQQL